MPKAIIYIDGFNFYYGALRGSTHKWLDLKRYFQLVRPADEVLHVNYFTSMVNGDAYRRQIQYIRALEHIGGVNIIYGNFHRKMLKCRVPLCAYGGPKEFRGSEEKRTDVNIAVQLMNDAIEGLCDLQVLVSGDSDLVPAVNWVRTHYPAMRLVAYIPARDPRRGAATELRASVHKARSLPLNLLQRAQLPLSLDEGKIAKPTEWA